MPLLPFNQVVNEVFNRPLTWRITQEGPGGNYEFISNNIIYTVYFESYAGTIIVLFEATPTGRTPAKAKNKYKDQGGQGRLESGNSVEVFSTVAAIIQDYHRKWGDVANEYIFGGVGHSRVRLYERLAKIMGQKLGWKVTKSPSEDGVSTDFAVARQ